MSDGNLRRRVIYPTYDRLRIPRVSWHGFRHLHSSLLAYLGIPVSVAQAQLGHADPRITLEIYTHMASGEPTAIPHSLATPLVMVSTTTPNAAHTLKTTIRGDALRCPMVLESFSKHTSRVVLLMIFSSL